MSTETALVSTAMDFLGRVSSTSEVLTLNLTNLVILLILKAIIFGFGLFSLGATDNNQHGYGRSSESSSGIQQSDLTGGMCFMMYTAGDEEKFSCVQRSACEDPRTATDYLTASKMWYKMHTLMKVVPFNDKYTNIMSGIQDATEHAEKGGDCTIYKW